MMLIKRTTGTIFVVVVLFSLQFGGCSSRAVEEVRSRPTIAANREWRFEEGCGYERCGGGPVDFLHGKDVKIRIESQVYVPPPVFLIRAQFILKKHTSIEIDPSLTRVELSNKRTLQAKGYNCYGKVFSANGQVQIPPIRSRTILTAEPGQNCLFFVFDPPAPKVNEVFKLIIGGATLKGRPLDIPEITFKPIMTRY